MEKQLSLSFAEPHHLTWLKYPAINLLQDDENPYLMPPVFDDRMHAPSDLIPHAQVTENASTESMLETSFFTVERANTGNLHPQPKPMTADLYPIMKFIHDVHSFQHTIGGTKLAFVTFSAPDGKHMVRVRRWSGARQADSGGDAYENRRGYDFLLTDLCKAARTPNAPAFITSMVMLVERQNARAMRHVDFVLSQYDWRDDMEGYAFKPARNIDYTVALRGVLRPVDVQTLDPEDRHCCICRDPYQESEEEPVALPCGHVVGAACVQRWYNSSTADDEVRSPADVQCPVCRQSPLAKHIIRALEFGLTDGVYHADPRYTEYENFERSCADLDNHPNLHFDDTETEFTPRLVVLKRALHLLLNGARLEDDLSTPRHLQAVNYPEMHAVLDAISKVFTAEAQATQEPVRIEIFVRMIEYSLRKALLKQAATPALMPFLGPTGLGNLKRLDFTDRIDCRDPLRPGFMEFLHRVISRAVYFQRVRPCNCSAGFHQHGLRTYYNSRESYE